MKNQIIKYYKRQPTDIGWLVGRGDSDKIALIRLYILYSGGATSQPSQRLPPRLALASGSVIIIIIVIPSIPPSLPHHPVQPSIESSQNQSPIGFGFEEEEGALHLHPQLTGLDWTGLAIGAGGRSVGRSGRFRFRFQIFV